jgi:hypothetical protein
VYGIWCGNDIGNHVAQSQSERNLPRLCKSAILSLNIFHCAADKALEVSVLVKLFITVGIVGLSVRSS